MPATAVHVATAENDENHLLGRQGGYTSAAGFDNPAAARDDPGGAGYVTIEVFASRADADARLAYLRLFRPPLGDGYDFQAGTALLRIGADLTPAQARVYAAAFTQASLPGSGS